MSRNVAQTPGEIIKNARKARRWSQSKLGEQVGISQPAVRKIEADHTTRSRYFPKIAQVLNIDPALLDPSLVSGFNEPATTPSQGPVSTIPGGDLIGSKDLPVYAITQGGRRGAEIMTTEPVDWVSRPQPLERVKDGYGLIVAETSMAPEFEPGDIALVHPHKPVVPGRTCVFYAERADGTVLCCIKRLRKETPDAWFVTQHNPPKGQKRDFVLKKADWQKAHLTVGNYKSR